MIEENDNMTRKKTIRETIPEMLILDCSEDGLSPVQFEMYKKANREMVEYKRKLELINQSNSLNGSSPTVDVALPNANQTQPIVIQNGQTHNNIMVLEQTPGVHLVVGSGTSPQQNPLSVAKTSVVRLPTTAKTVNRPTVLTSTRPSSNNNPVVLRALPNKFPTTVVGTTSTPPPPPSTGAPKIQVKPPQLTDSLSNSGSPAAINSNATPRAVASTSNDVVDLTEDDNHESESTADQKEIAIGKVSEKTFPSLVVNVKVFLKSKEISLATSSSERVLLDGRVKRVLMLTPTTFTEWLLQQGLLRCEQVCSIHRGPNGRNNSLKLGMYSDASKFPYSGGYIWISECCPTTSVSVFSGSLFEGAPHPPTVLLKLIYHWACQTIVQNVLQWVKVDNLYVKNMYTNLRAVCTAAVHEKYGKLGGKNRKVEVGVISLGTTTQDGQMKHIKVEVLGVLETRTKRLRLKALEPIPDTDRQFMKKKFMKILEPLQQWVDKESIIVTDYTVDKLTCQKMGFNNIIQNSHNSNSSPNSQMTNQTIMEYLRKVIPKMFQNTLSLLSRQIIQQFLDELVWRETWGPIPSRAFDMIIQHISEQTSLDTGGTLVNRLFRIALNPLKNWKYDQWAANCQSPPSSVNVSADGVNSDLSRSPAPEVFQLNSETVVTTVMPNTPSVPAHPSTSNHNNTNEGQMVEAAMIALEPYYYGTLIGSPEYAMERYDYTFTCVLCKFEFRNVAKFSDHLILHAFNKNVAKEAISKELCKLCLKICPKSNNHNLSTHRIQVHSDRQTCRTLCKICSIKHKDAASLQAHMISTHCELDMPYHCEICNYRTSFSESIHHHFNNAHGKGTKGYCPYCLKVMQFAEMKGKNLENNQLRFVLHIQKHQLTVNRKCEKCLLNFTNRGLLKDHQDNYHQTCKSMEEAERYIHECTLMAAPLIDPLPNSTSAAEPTYRGTLKLSFDSTNAFCCECDGNITPDHFVGHLLCSKCKFQTCCNFSMKEHNALMHGNTLLHLRPPIIGRAPVMNNPLHCLCGYSTRNGSHMANHLCECGYYTCYTSKRKLEEIEIKKEEDSTTSASGSATSSSTNNNINDVRKKDDVVIMMAAEKGNNESSPSSAGTAASCSTPSNLAVIDSSTSSLLPIKDTTTSNIDHQLSTSATVNLLTNFISSNTATTIVPTFNEVKEENMKMSVDVEEVDDAMECDDDLLDSMTVDDSSTEAMILD